MKAQLVDWLLPSALIVAILFADVSLPVTAAAVAVFAVCGWLYVIRRART